MTARELRVGKHKIDIRFWREGNQTLFEVTKGNPSLAEQCDFFAKFAQLKNTSDPISRD